MRFSCSFRCCRSGLRFPGTHVPSSAKASEGCVCRSAVAGSAPPRITPVIMPGSATRPIVAIDATVGIIDACNASRKYGWTASLSRAPWARD